MAAQTITKKVQASRQYDHLYDRDYTVSSERDHSRTQAAATHAANRLVKVPDAENMFSELAHHPRDKIVMKKVDPLPSGIPREFAPQAAPQQSMAEADVTGRNRVRYMGMPKVSYVKGQVAATLKLAQAQETFVAAPPEPKTKTVGCQTMYRESETQTDPWSADYVVRPGSAPEVLTLASLSYGVGLPAGLAEVEMIERARERRAWEASLPDASDPANNLARAYAMEEQEMKEWRHREEEIQKMQDERLGLLQKLVVELQDQKQQEQTEKLEKLWQARQEEKEKTMAKLQLEALKRMRKLERERQGVEGKVQRRDIVSEYSDPASHVFAPVVRNGAAVLDKEQKNFVVKSHHLTTYEGLLELEASLPVSVTTPRISSPSRRAGSGGLLGKTGAAGGYQGRQTQRLQEKLAELDNTFRMTRTGQLPTQAALRTLKRVEKPRERPKTPEADALDAEDDAREAAVVLLQSILRGRSVQNEMYEGKERRRHLIDELRSTHALQVAEQELKEKERRATLQAREEEEKRADLKKAALSVLNDVQAGHVGASLDHLSKELVRLQEERRIHAFAMLADRQRRMREAEEAGRRQAEELERQRYDEVFRQVVKVHQVTVDSYLEDIILAAQDSVADQLAREQVRDQARKIYEVADAMHASGYDTTELGALSIASDLVSSFLLPEVERQTKRDRIKAEQRKFIKAAHDSMKTEVVAAMEPALRRLASAKDTATEKGTGTDALPPLSPKSARSDTHKTQSQGTETTATETVSLHAVSEDADV